MASTICLVDSGGTYQILWYVLSGHMDQDFNFISLTVKLDPISIRFIHKLGCGTRKDQTVGFKKCLHKKKSEENHSSVIDQKCDSILQFQNWDSWFQS